MDKETQKYILKVENDTKKILAKIAKYNENSSSSSKTSSPSRTLSPRASSRHRSPTKTSSSPKKVDLKNMKWDGTFRKKKQKRVLSKTTPLPRVDAILKSFETKKNTTVFAGTSKYEKNLMTSPLKGNAKLTSIASLKNLMKATKRHHRSEHDVQKSHCKACWSNPSVMVGTERGGRVSERLKDRNEKRAVAQQLQQQGPTSWSHYNLRQKYRDETGRTTAWQHSVRAQERARREKEELGRVIPVVVVTRHPLHIECDAEVVAMNKLSFEQAELRNKLKKFSLSVHEVWKAHPPEIPSNEKETNGKCLNNRWDIASIESGDHQVQSVSLKKALSTARVTPLENLTRSVREVQMARLSSEFVMEGEQNEEEEEEGVEGKLEGKKSEESVWIFLKEYDNIEFKNLWFEIEDQMRAHGVRNENDSYDSGNNNTDDDTIDDIFDDGLVNIRPLSSFRNKDNSNISNNKDQKSQSRSKKKTGGFGLLDSESSEEELSSEEEEIASEASLNAARIAFDAAEEANHIVRPIFLSFYHHSKLSNNNNNETQVCEAFQVADAMLAASNAARVALRAVRSACRAAANVSVQGWRVPPRLKGKQDTRRGKVRVYMSEHHIKIDMVQTGGSCKTPAISAVVSRASIRRTLKNDPDPPKGKIEIADYVLTRLRLMRHVDDGFGTMSGEMNKRHDGPCYFDENNNLVGIHPPRPPPNLVFDDNHPSYTPNSFWTSGRSETHNAVPGATVLGVSHHKKQGAQLSRAGISNEKCTVRHYEFLCPQLVTACFRRDGRRFNSIIANLSASLEIPMFHPLCGAWDDEILKPIPLEEGHTDPTLVNKMAPCEHHVVNSVTDLWTPSLSLALTDAVTTRDVDPLISGHRRWSTIRDRNGFRLLRVFHLDQVDPNLPVRTFGVSEPAALPNTACAWPRRYAYHYDYYCTSLVPHWSKSQTMVMLKATDAAGPNEPLLFSSHMSEYALRDLTTEKRCDQIEKEKQRKDLEDARAAKVNMATALDQMIRKTQMSREKKKRLENNLKHKELKRLKETRGKIPDNLKESEWIKRASDATVIGRQKIEEKEWVMLQRDDLVFYRLEGELPGVGYQWDPPTEWSTSVRRRKSEEFDEKSPRLELAPQSARKPKNLVLEAERYGEEKRQQLEREKNENDDDNEQTKSEDEEEEEEFEEEEEEEEEMSSSSSDESEDWAEDQAEDHERVPNHLDDLMHTLVGDDRFLGAVAKRFGMVLPKEPLPTHSQYRIGMRVEGRLASGIQWWPCTIADIHPDGTMDLVYDLPNTAEQRVEQELVRMPPIRRTQTKRSAARETSSIATKGRRKRKGKQRVIGSGSSISTKEKEEEESSKVPELPFENMNIPGFKPKNETNVKLKKGMQPRNEHEEVLRLLEEREAMGDRGEIIHTLHLKNWRLMRPSAIPKGFVTAALDTHTAKAHKDSDDNKVSVRSMPGMYDPAEDSYEPRTDIVIPRNEIIMDIMKDTLKFTIEQKARQGGAAATTNPESKTTAAAMGIELGDEKTDPEVQLIEWTKKCFTAVRNASMAEVEEYLDYGVLAQEAKDGNGNTLLHVAVQQGLKGIVKLLLRRMADINAKNHAGNTPLHYAFEYNFDELGEYLISKGADPTMQNAQGLTCYEGLHMENLNEL